MFDDYGCWRDAAHIPLTKNKDKIRENCKNKTSMFEELFHQILEFVFWDPKPDMQNI